MQWWIGQVTDPDKGEWGDAYERVRSINGEQVYGFRCRVRIVGYHGNDTDLPDKDLPLAHILLPSNTTTIGGCGRTVQYQGGEVVVGFFLDGEDGQQPIIFGTLFKQTFVKDGLTSSMFNTKNQIDFIPYTPPKVRQRSGKHRFFSESPWPGGFTDGEAVKTIAMKQMEAATNITVPNFSPCEDNEISKISETIKNFTRKMETLQSLNEQSTYVDCSFNDWRVSIFRVKFFIVSLIFDISLSSHGLKLGTVIFVAASICFIAIVFTASPSVNPPGQGDSEKNLCLPDLCLTFGGVYGIKSI